MLLLALGLTLLATSVGGLGEDAKPAGPPSVEKEAEEVEESAGTVSEQVGEACVTALAEREGKTREEIIQFITGELELSLTGVGDNNCDIALATASPIAIYFNSLSKWLKDAGHFWQFTICLGACFTGVAVALDGPKIWRVLFTFLAACGAAGVTHHEANLWQLAPNLISDIVLMGQAFFAAGLAVHVGFEGSQVLFGVLLGLVGAYGIGDWARDLEPNAPGLCLLWYEVGAVLGFLLYTLWRKAVLSTLAPMLGSFLVTTGSITLLSRGVHMALGSDSHEESKVPIFPAPGAPWVEAATSLLGNAGSQALTVHCACALFATFMHGSFESRPLTVGVLVLSILVAAISAVGDGCQAWPAGIEANGVACPAWLKSVKHPAWPVFGSVLWATGTGLAAWLQLGRLEEWEEDNFWRSEFNKYAVMHPSELHGSTPRSHEPFMTQLPHGYSGVQYGNAGAAPPVTPHEDVGPFNGLVDSLERWWADVNTHPRDRHPQ